MSYPRRPSDDAPFRHDKKTVDEARAEGFATGLNWNNNWRPGGPWVYPLDKWAHPDLIAYALLSKARYDAWHEGFFAARALVE